MDFSLDETQSAVRELADQILRDHTDRRPPDDPGADLADGGVWRRLAQAGLVGIALPEEVGGGAAGFLELCMVAQAVGAAGLHLPVIESAVVGALAVDRYGSDEQRKRILPALADGTGVLTTVLCGPAVGDSVTQPSVRARREGEQWLLEGELPLVAWADAASLVLLPAVDDSGLTGLFLLDPTQPAVTVAPRPYLDGRTFSELRLAGASVPAFGMLLAPGEAADALAWIEARAEAACCMHQLGVCEAALRLTATYVSEREQFGRPVGTFQAVSQRLGDAYIDVEGIRLTALQAAWRLAHGVPAAEALAVARWWAADAGPRVLRATQHLHGGIGIDLDYPIHRYYLAGKANALALKGAARQLVALGDLLADH